MNNWKIKFAVIWSGQVVSFLTSAVLQMALIWHLTTATGSALVLSLASIAGFLPAALLGSFAGALVDRWNRKVTMIGADLYIALISLSLIIFTFFLELPIWLVLIVLFLRSIGTAFHMPAIAAVTPLIVPEAYLTKCAGYTQSLQTAGFIAGTSIAAILYPLWGVRGMVALDVGGAVLASLAVVFVKIPSPPKTERQEPVKPGIFADIKEGFKLLRTHKGIFALLWIGAIFAFLYSPINALFPLMSMGHFGGTTTHAGIAEIVFAGGIFIGGLILGIWGGFKNRIITICFSIAIMGIAIGISGLLPTYGFVVFAALCLLMGLTVPFFNGPQMALIQEKIMPEYLGRVFGFFGSIMSFALLLGLAFCGIFADMAGVNNWFAISGGLIVLLAVFAVLMPSVRKADA